MVRNPKRRISFLTLAFVVLAVSASAQSVEVFNGRVAINDATTGVRVWEADSGADVDAGGAGWNADVTLRNSGGIAFFSYNGGSADLTLGGGTQDGDLRLRDSDGTTTSIDLRGNAGHLVLGSADEDGDIWIWDDSPDNAMSFNLDGATGTITNQFGGNGVVKGWARINANGSILSCYRCQATQTGSTGVGGYEVDFTPIGVNISSRPWLCSVGHGGNNLFGWKDIIGCVSRNGDPSSVFVGIQNNAGTAINRDFTIVVF